MIWESILLNKIYKTNQFKQEDTSKIKNNTENKQKLEEIISIYDLKLFISYNNALFTKHNPIPNKNSAAHVEIKHFPLSKYYDYQINQNFLIYFNCIKAYKQSIRSKNLDEIRFSYKEFPFVRYNSENIFDENPYDNPYIPMYDAGIEIYIEKFDEEDNENNEKHIEDLLLKLEKSFFLLLLSINHTKDYVKQYLSHINKALSYSKNKFLFSNQPSIYDILLFSIIYETYNNIYEDLFQSQVKDIDLVISLLNLIITSTGFDYKKSISLKKKFDDEVKKKTIQLNFSQELYSSVMNRDINLLFDLLLKGHNPNSKDVLKKRSLLHISTSNARFDMLSLLISFGADVNSVDHEEMNVLFSAVDSGDTSIVDFFIDSLHMNLNQTECQGRSIFYWACCIGNIKMIRHLIKKGCDVSLPSIMGRSALSKACWNGRYDIVRLLLEETSVDINQKDIKGRTPLHNSCWGEYGGRFGKKMNGLNSSDSEEITEILLEKGACFEIEDNEGYTPLMLSASTHGIDSLRLLIAYGGNVNHVNKYNQTAVMNACLYGNFDSMEIILKNTVESSVIMNMKDLVFGFDVFLYGVYYNKSEELRLIHDYCKLQSTSQLFGSYSIIFNKDYILNAVIVSIRYNSIDSFMYLYDNHSSILTENEIEHILNLSLLCVRLEISMLLLIKYNNIRLLLNSQFRIFLLISILSEDSILLDIYKEYSKIEYDSKDYITSLYDKEIAYKSSIDNTKVSVIIKEFIENTYDSKENHYVIDKFLFEVLVKHGFSEFFLGIAEKSLVFIENFIKKDEFEGKVRGLCGNLEFISAKRLLILDISHVWIGYFRVFYENTVLNYIINSLPMTSSEYLIMSYMTFISKGKIIINSDVNNNDTILHNVFQNGDLKNLKHVLSCLYTESGNSISIIKDMLVSKNSQGYTPFDMGIRSKHYNIIKDFFDIVSKSFDLSQVSQLPFYIHPLLIVIDKEECNYDFSYRILIENEIKSLKSHIKSVKMTDFHMKITDPYTKFIDLHKIFYKERLCILVNKILSNKIHEILSGNGNETSNQEEMIITVESMERMVKSLSLEKVIGVDFEFSSIKDMKNGVICLIQMSSFEKSYIIDSLLLDRTVISSYLKPIFEDISIVKVFHGFDNDLIYLTSNFNIFPINVFDTSQAFLTFEKYFLQEKKGRSVNPPSLAYLTRLILRKEIDKSYQKAEWRLRPLTEKMIEYAYNDSRVVVYLFYFFLGCFTFFTEDLQVEAKDEKDDQLKCVFEGFKWGVISERESIKVIQQYKSSSVYKDLLIFNEIYLVCLLQMKAQIELGEGRYRRVRLDSQLNI